MFWWLYYSKIILQTDVPLVLWIQGGPVSCFSFGALVHAVVTPI
jgi:hypothetical protein